MIRSLKALYKTSRQTFTLRTSTRRFQADRLTLMVALCVVSTCVQAQTWAEQLGFPKNARVLILHVDDAGMSLDSNEGAIKAMKEGVANSVSVMMPCPWVPGFVSYLKQNPLTDAGLHLTLTSEWDNYRWGPLSGKPAVPGLVDAQGALWGSVEEVVKHASADEVYNEIKAQLDRARGMGFDPTHLDSHMGTLYQNKALFEVFLRVARTQKLPVRVAKTWLARADFLPSTLTADDVYIDRTLDINPTVAPQDWAKFYTDALKKLEPGVTEVIIHLAYDDAEMKGVTVNHPDWGAAWRQRDYEYFTSDAFRKALQENQIKLITWRELGKLVK